MPNPGGKTPDDAIISAVESAVADGETDYRGGVRPETIAERVGISPSTAYKRCEDLDDRGLLDSTIGWPPETSADTARKPRKSYLKPRD